MHRLVISAPFGNYLHLPGVTRTLGTFTVKRRGGRAYRLWRCLWTLRPSWRLGGWVNRLGLPNPGIDALPSSACSDDIVSVHGFTTTEWVDLVCKLRERGFRGLVELNLSCPNVNHRPSVAELLPAVEVALRDGLRLSAKLPPYRWFDYAAPLYDAGVSVFHACNTMWTPAGGLSGKTLKPYALWAVRDLKERWGAEVSVTGGGGVDSPADVDDYFRAGADRVAVGAALLRLRPCRLLARLRDHVEAVRRDGCMAAAAAASSIDPLYAEE